MAKDTCETSRSLSTAFLKKHGYLDGVPYGGTVTWTHGFSGNKSSISIAAYVFGEDPHIQLQYTHTSWDELRSEMDYRVDAVSTPCHFGGRRYWFICPLYRNGIACGRRIGVIYGAGKYYGCRHCYDLAYNSQQQTHTRTGLLGLVGKIFDHDELEEKAEALRVKYWKGRPTKRYARLLRKMGNFPSEQELNSILQK